MSEPTYDVIGVFVPKTNSDSNSSSVPPPEVMQVGELATNSTAGKLFIKLESGDVADLVVRYAHSGQMLMDSQSATGNAGTSELFARADHQHPADTSKVSWSQVGTPSGVCPLDATGKVSSLNLPSYVDDVLEFALQSQFPVPGESGKIYIETSTNTSYRWTGTVYVSIGSAGNGGTSGLAGGDLTGSYPSPTLAKIQGKTVSISSLSDGQVLKYNAATQTWYNGADNAGVSGAAGGDLTGTLPNPTIAKLQGKTLAITSPADGQVLKYNAATQTWYNGADNTSGTSSGGGISTLTGDVSASGTGTVNSTVVGIYGQLVSSSLLPNQSGQGLIWNANTARYERQAIVVEADTITGGTY